MRKRTDNPTTLMVMVSGECERRIRELGERLGLGTRARGRVVERAVDLLYSTTFAGAAPPEDAAPPSAATD